MTFTSFLIILELDPKQYFDMQLELDDPSITGYDKAPCTLEEACEELQENKVLRKHLGDDLIDGFIKVKRKEVKAYKKQISQWEIQFADDY